MPGLTDAIIAPELRWAKFFNGRLLTGADLDGEQRSNRAARRLLGQAIGAGVAYGLEVAVAPGLGSAVQPVLLVGAGLALNRFGDALELGADTTLALNAGPAPGTEGPDQGFTVCRPLAPGVYTASTGAFILTVGPSSTATGRVPVSGLGNDAASCNVAYNLDGVQFRLVRIELDQSLDAAPSLLRNRLAHLVFGTTDDARLSAVVEPFAHAAGSYGVLDQLPPGCIGDDQVPLALLHWTSAGVEFLDQWTVRRRVVKPISGPAWPTLMGDRRRAEAEAMFMQFQDQIEDLLAAVPAASNVVASTYFDYLPPVGLLPAVTSGTNTGFDPFMFFGAQASTEIAAIEGESVAALLHEGLWHEPIAIGSSERVQLYEIRENAQAVTADPAVQAAVVFAKHSLRYRGVARVATARFGSSRFTSRVI
jgi:hypothetical protein